MILNQWYAILPSKQVKSEQITAIKRLDMNLALFRNSKGELKKLEYMLTNKYF